MQPLPLQSSSSLLETMENSYTKWKEMQEPSWANLGYPSIDYQDLIYYAAPKQTQKKASLEEVDPKLLETFDKLGIPY